MKDYIREILEEVNDIQVRYTKPSLVRNYTDKDYAIGSYEKLVCKMIDIINNLQKENEKLKEIVYNLTTLTVNGDRTQIKNTAQYKLEQCQHRIDKAIEYIKSYNLPDDLGKLSECPISVNELKELLSILRGDIDE